MLLLTVPRVYIEGAKEKRLDQRQKITDIHAQANGIEAIRRVVMPAKSRFTKFWDGCRLEVRTQPFTSSIPGYYSHYYTAKSPP